MPSQSANSDPSYIDKGVFLNLTMKHLPEKRKGEKKHKRKTTQNFLLRLDRSMPSQSANSDPLSTVMLLKISLNFFPNFLSCEWLLFRAPIFRYHRTRSGSGSASHQNQNLHYVKNVFRSNSFSISHNSYFVNNFFKNFLKREIKHESLILAQDERWRRA